MVTAFICYALCITKCCARYSFYAAHAILSMLCWLCCVSYAHIHCAQVFSLFRISHSAWYAHYTVLPVLTVLAGESKSWTGIASSADGICLFAVVDGGAVWSSRDSGRSWEQCPSPCDPQRWSAIATSHDGSRLVAVVNGGNIWTSINYGHSWTGANPNLSKEWTSVSHSKQSCSHCPLSIAHTTACRAQLVLPTPLITSNSSSE